MVFATYALDVEHILRVGGVAADVVAVKGKGGGWFEAGRCWGKGSYAGCG